MSEPELPKWASRVQIGLTNRMRRIGLPHVPAAAGWTVDALVCPVLTSLPPMGSRVKASMRDKNGNTVTVYGWVFGYSMGAHGVIAARHDLGTGPVFQRYDGPGNGHNGVLLWRVSSNIEDALGKSLDNESLPPSLNTFTLVESQHIQAVYSVEEGVWLDYTPEPGDEEE